MPVLDCDDASGSFVREWARRAIWTVGPTRLHVVHGDSTSLLGVPIYSFHFFAHFGNYS